MNVASQKRTKIFFKDYVECFYSNKETIPINIYDNQNGKVISKLKVLTETHCWYKFAISKPNKGWLKVENIIVFSSCKENKLNENIEKYKEKWLLAKKLKIDGFL